jgi:hypothetical protein
MKTEYMGSVTVDSGQIFIGDPCYITSEFEDQYKSGSPTDELSYSACCEASLQQTSLVGKRYDSTTALGCSMRTDGDGIMDIFKVTKKNGQSYLRIQRRSQKGI